MIYLSAQPDDFYFTWQLELQIHNFSDLKIPAECIHMLIAFDPQVGIQEHFRTLIARYRHLVSFYCYPDSRKDTEYVSSVRPHIIKQHFRAFPNLEREWIFYHDSDIILREKLDTTLFCDDETWYVSDTRSYLDTSYIRSSSSENVLLKMCDIIGVSIEQVEYLDENCGGAQYILKGTHYNFWQKVEEDCDRMFEYLINVNSKMSKLVLQNNEVVRNAVGIQAWCADMWVLLWNSILQKKKVKITKELDFSWVGSSLDTWHGNKILHYTGGGSGNDCFEKLDYYHYAPFYAIQKAPTNAGNCSDIIKQYIVKVRDKLNEERILLDDTVVAVEGTAQTRQSAKVIIRYLEKYFKTKIIHIERDEKDGFEQLLSNMTLADIYTKYNDVIERKYLIIIDSQFIMPYFQLCHAMLQLKKSDVDIVKVEDTFIAEVDLFFFSMLEKFLDTEYLSQNHNKLTIGERRGSVGMLVCNWTSIKEAAMGGISDVPIKVIKAPLFKLPA